MTRKNPTSPIRSGFSYQDWWALAYCADCITNPKAYKWIQFETVPDEILGGYFNLDDILLCHEDSSYSMYQVKYKQNAKEDRWNWKNMLARRTDRTGKKRDSLIQRLSRSFSRRELAGKIRTAALVTNGLASEDVEQVLGGDRISMTELRTQSPDISAEIEDQLGGSDEAVRFFGGFRFMFGQKGIEELENQVRNRFRTQLRATVSGINALLLRIKRECRKKRTAPITAEQLREWCEFDMPRALNQAFPVPEDFELFDKRRHELVMTSLGNREGGIIVVCGKPGSGKSTYLASLHTSLRDAGVVSVRHHFYLSQDDPDSLERLGAIRVVEAIKAQIKEYHEALGELAYKNSMNIELREFLAELAAYYYQRDQAFVLILDGLDHVMRYGEEKELRSLLHDICHPQPGFWVILGTQEAAKRLLPQTVFDFCPQDQWIEIEGLSEEAVRRIISKNVAGLNLPEDEFLMEEIHEVLFEMTAGNPLHLRYTLQQLGNTLPGHAVTLLDCRDLVPYDGDIARYYDSLWRQLPENGKTIAIVIAGIGFSLSREQLFDLMATGAASDISEGYRSVAHLLLADGPVLSIYHSSFKKFILQQAEFMQQQKSVKLRARDWLENSSYEDLRWAEQRKLAYDLGDSAPIMELDRNWVIEAVCFPRDAFSITSQLDVAAKAAFQERALGKALRFSVLRDRLKNAFESQAETADRIWVTAFRARNPDVRSFDLRTLSPTQIEHVVQVAQRQGVPGVAEKAIAVLNSRHRHLRIRKKGEIGSEIPALAKSLVDVISHDRKSDAGRLHRYVTHYRETGWSADLFGIFVATLLRTEQFSRAYDLLKLKLTDEEKQSILDKCAEHDLETGSERFLRIISEENEGILSRLCLLYKMLSGAQVRRLPDLPVYDALPTTVPEYETGKRAERAQIFYEGFILGIMYALAGKEPEVNRWIADAGESWVMQTMSCILSSGVKIGRCIKGDKTLAYTDVFAGLTEVTPLRWPEDRKIYELQRSLRISLSWILKVLQLLRCNARQPVELRPDELSSILSCPYYGRQELLGFLLTLDRPILSKEAYEEFLRYEKERWKTLVVPLEERASHYLDLAALATIHLDDRNRDDFLKLAVDNLLGYGSHKDMYLDGVLHSIEVCHDSGLTEPQRWMRRVAPMVESVLEYTDGDETEYFRKDLADILVNVDASLLRKYYFQKARDEKLLLAQAIFKYVLRSLDFTKDEAVALATTALDKDSHEELEEIAGKSIGAKQAYHTIEDYLGKIEYEEDEDRSIAPDVADRGEDYSSIDPAALADHLKTFGDTWHRREFAKGWADHWVGKNMHGRSREAYDALTKLVEQNGLHRADAAVLDLLYPIAYEYDPETAFEYLCWAQANDNGWSLYWTHKWKAEKRWGFLKDKWPKRYMEFFEKSIRYSSRWHGAKESWFVPLPRAAEFLALFGDIGALRDVVLAGIETAESLMADLQLPNPEWLALTEVDDVDILLQRLVWPSPLVRERSAVAIAALIRGGPLKQRVLARLLDWIGKQELESVIAIGLLPILKAAERNAGDLKHIRVEEVADALPAMSIVTETLLRELARLVGGKPPVFRRKRSIPLPPDGYRPSDFFRRHITWFLAPVYLNRAEQIEENARVDFVQLWSYAAQEMMAKLGLREEVGDTADFAGVRHSATLQGISSLLSEVYRSAFLRVIEYLHEQGLIPEDFYLDFAYSTVPVELSYWKVAPGRAPAWWPKIHSTRTPDSEKEHLLNIVYERSVLEAIEPRSGHVVLGMDGAIEFADGWSRNFPNVALGLVAFGYKVLGPDIPRAKEVAAKVLYSPSILLVPSKTDSPLNLLECHKQHVPGGNQPIELRDLIVYPLIARNRDLVIGLWQWFRGFSSPHGLFGLNPELATGLDIRLGAREWWYMRGETKVACCADWLEGLREMYDNGSGIPHGHYIQADLSFVSSHLEAKGLRLGYVVKTTYRHRARSYSEPEEFVDYRLMRVGRVIV